MTTSKRYELEDEQWGPNQRLFPTIPNWAAR